jgi:competence transcription factor ComK
VNSNGSNEQKLNIVLPPNFVLFVDHDGGQIKLNKNEKKILFKAKNIIGSSYSLFSCSYDGSNVIKIIDNIGTSFDME